VASWKDPSRHRSWNSDTNLSVVFAGGIVLAYIIWEIVGTAPQGMVTLVGVAGGAFFGAVSGDKKKRDRATEEQAAHAEETANRAERTADGAARAAKAGDLRADRAQTRESEPSLHHDEEDGTP
jgi:hypothetical protein